MVETLGGYNAPVSAEASRMHRVFRTVNEMVRDRGFVVAAESLAISLPDFVARFARDGDVDYNSLTFVAMTPPGEDQRRVLVYFPSEESVGVEPIRKLTTRLAQNQVSHAIIVYRKTITSSAAKVIATLASTFRIEQFNESELVVNITKHELVPKHIVMTSEEKKTLLKRYRLKETQLPRILHSDPVARYYGLTRGQIVKIVRNSETAGRYVTYRICM